MSEDVIFEVKVCDAARIPVVWVVTHEESRVEVAISQEMNRLRGQAWTWSLTSNKGIAGWERSLGSKSKAELPFDTKRQGSPSAAMANVIEIAAKTRESLQNDRDPTKIAIIFRDPHVFLQSEMTFIRSLRDAARELRDTTVTVICISPIDRLPADLQVDVKVIRPGLPKRETIAALIEENLLPDYISSNQFPQVIPLAKDPCQVARLVDACCGLTLVQANDAIAQSLARTGMIDIDFVHGVKTEQISSIPGLTYEKVKPDMSQVGGLAGLKEWVNERKDGFSKEAREFNLPVPRALLALGVQGCLSGETKVIYKRGNRLSGREISMTDLYLKFNGLPTKTRLWGDLKSPTYLQSCRDDGTIYYNRVVAVVHSGKKPTLKLTTKGGRVLVCTHDHPVMTADGTFAQAGSLQPGSILRMRGSMLPQPGVGRVKHTVLDELVSIEKDEAEQDVYDVEMEGPDHNFVAESFIVHNCGKSLFAKALASLLEFPLIRLTPHDIKEGIVGGTEANLRRVKEAIEALGFCVVWIDELEKSLPKAGEHNVDGGTSDALLQGFLHWFQERPSGAFIIATANDASCLPPELLRKGRWDEIFFIDLPTPSERREILKIHLDKVKRELPEKDIAAIADATEGFSGAELEDIVISGLWKVWPERKPLTKEAILTCAAQSVPLSRMMKEKIDGLRDWAKNRARPASKSDDELIGANADAAMTGRKRSVIKMMEEKN